jgi:glycine cleavage system regulatory protein
MQIPLVMTIIGEDRTGLVESVARLVAEQGGNWLESRMCRLGGEFAGILRIHIPKDKESVLIKALRNLEAQGLTAVVHPDKSSPAAQNKKLASLELVCHDRIGIVLHISSVLARQGINVEELETECTSAPMSGEMLFKATAKLSLPDSCSLAQLRQELEDVAGNMMIDLSFGEQKPER